MQKQSFKVEILSNHRCLLGEGPVWDEADKSLLWVDILNGHIHKLNISNGATVTIKLPKKVGAVSLCSSGNLLAAQEDGLMLLNGQGKFMAAIAHPEATLAGNRYNDGKADAAGRVWIGSMAYDEQPGCGNLYMVNPDGSYEKKIAGVTVSNGLCWTSDNQKFYYIDSPTRQVVAYDFESESGNISNRREIIDIPEGDGFPDGMTIDTEGMLWIAHWDGWQVSRWNPETGERLLVIKFPAARITSCTFGGESLNDLYVTSATIGLTDQQLEEQPLAGALFVIRNCGFTGLPANRFLINS